MITTRPLFVEAWAPLGVCPRPASDHVALGHLEGVLDHVDVRLLAFEDDLDDVEADGDLVILVVEEAHPCEGTADDELLLLQIYGLAGLAESGAAAGFDFDEDEGLFLFVPADEVDLTAAGAAVVAVEDAVTVTPEPGGGETLAATAELEMGRAGGCFTPGEAPTGAPGGKSGDESGKDRGPGDARGGGGCHSLCDGKTHTWGMGHPSRPSYGRASPWR